MIASDDMPAWRNGLARWTSNPKVVGSTPTVGAFLPIFLLLDSENWYLFDVKWTEKFILLERNDYDIKRYKMNDKRQNVRYNFLA